MNTFCAFITFAYSFNPTCGVSYLAYPLFGIGTLSISMVSQILNQMNELEFDKKMRRTFTRPLVTGKISYIKAKNYALFLFFSSMFCYFPLKYLDCYSLQAQGFSISIIILYNLVYTPLKRKSNFSMPIGAIVGAIVPILGSYSATGLLFNEVSFIMGLFMFAWQYPHFYGICYKYRQCYSNAGYEFISKYPLKDKIAKIQIFFALILMELCAIKFYSLGIMGLNLTILFNLSLIYTFLSINFLTTKPLKLLIKSYIPFMLFLMGLILTFEELKEFLKLIKNFIILLRITPASLLQVKNNFEK